MNSERISKILELKQFTEDMCEVDLKKQLESLHNEKKKLTSIEEDLQKVISEYTQSQQDGSIDIKELDFFYSYLLHLNKLVEKQKKIIMLKTQEVQVKKQELFNAHKEKQMLEKIHDRINKEELKGAEKKEQDEIDLNCLYKKNRNEK